METLLCFLVTLQLLVNQTDIIKNDHAQQAIGTVQTHHHLIQCQGVGKTTGVVWAGLGCSSRPELQGKCQIEYEDGRDYIDSNGVGFQFHLWWNLYGLIVQKAVFIPRS